MFESYAQADYDGSGRMVVTFVNLRASQLEALLFLMRTNGRGEPFDQRAAAGAHLGRWQPESGIAEVTLHGDDPEPFLTILRKHVRVEIKS